MDLDISYLEALRAAPTPILEILLIKNETPVAQWLDLVTRPEIHTLALEVVIVQDDGPRLLPALSVAHGILSQLTQLVSLKIVAHEMEATYGGTTHFPVLESLDLHVVTAELDELDELLEHLTMPRLRHLTVDAPRILGSHAPFFTTLRTTAPHLCSLELGFNSFTRDALRGTLPHIATLTRLLIHDTLA
ncbi:hypothetical protein C8R43DRAFT_1136003 [Mycena crocata]|nr:hypothetical protein C8R43DRAFT_1136003 [Mycena crocata]